MTKKSLIAFSLGAAVLLSSCSASTSTSPGTPSSNTGDKIPTGNGAPEQVTLTLFNSGAAAFVNNILDNPVMNKITEETGVVIDWSPAMGSNTGAEAAAMLIASNELPDIWLQGDSSINATLLNNRLILPLDEQINSVGKDIQEIAGEALNFTRFKFGTDQNYFIPIQVGGVNWYPSGYDNTFSFRYDLWDQMGKPKMETYDDVIHYCVEAMKLEPQNEAGQKNYGVAIPLGGKEIDYLDWNISHFMGQGNKNIFVNIDFEKDEIVPRFAQDSAWLTGAEFFFKMNQAGAFDPESATMNGDQVREKGGSQRYFLGLANWQIGWPNDKLVAAKEPVKGYAPLIVEADSDYVFCRTSTIYGNGMYYSLSNSCKNPEAAMRFINYSASWDGAQVFANGPEGTTWDYVGDRPTAHKKDPNAVADPDLYKKIGISYVAPNMQVNGFREDPRGWKTIYAQDDASSFRENMSAGELKFIDDNNYEYGTQYYDDKFKNNTFATPVFDMIPPIDTASDLSVIETDSKTLAVEYSVKLIYAADQAEFDKVKAEFLAELDRIGYQEGVEHYQAEYAASKSKFEAFLGN